MGGINQDLLYALMGQQQPMGMAQSQSAAPMANAGQPRAGLGGMGGIEALMGNPLFGAGMGLLSSAHSGGNPYASALTGMLGTTAFKRQQQEYQLKTDEAKAQREQLMTVSKLAMEGLKTLDVDADGNISPAEQARGDYLRAAAQTGDSSMLQKATDTLASLQPKAGSGAMSTIGKLASDFKAGLITQEQFNAGYQKATTSHPLVEISNSKPIGAGAINWSDGKGSKADPRWTTDEAVQAGFYPISPTQRDAIGQAGMSAPALGAMMGFGGIGTDKSLFSPDGANLGDRAIAAASARIKSATSDPNSPELLSYTTFKEATLSGLARLVGQVGALTERDVQSVASLWPTPGLDTEGVAATKFRNIVTLLKSKGVGEKYLGALGVPEQFLGEHKADDLSYEAAPPP